MRNDTLTLTKEGITFALPLKPKSFVSRSSSMNSFLGKKSAQEANHVEISEIDEVA